MRYFVRMFLIVLVAISSFTFLQQESAEAGVRVDNSYFDSVVFECPNIINFSGQWMVYTDDDALVRVYDAETGTILDTQFFTNTTAPGINYFSGSFNLSEPLPNSVIVDMWQGSFLVAEVPAVKTVGLAEVYNPPAPEALALLGPTPPNPVGHVILEDSQLITIPECASIAGCDATFTIYGTALVLDQQLGYSEPNGEPARDLAGNLIWVLHDVDQDGQDTYLIVDIQKGAEGETWLGIFIGSCNPVYVPLNKVYPLNAIPVD